MQDILTDITHHKRMEVELMKQTTPQNELEKQLAEATLPPCRSMKQALMDSPTGIIAEFKRRSPSKGWIKREANPSAILPAYEQAGASAISVLTDKAYFGGTLEDLRTARRCTRLPILRKDFIIDEYQLLQARLAGADAVLLIAACLSYEDCARLAEQAHRLGLEILLEIHSTDELAYASLNPDMLGVNNRHLGSFRTDVNHSFAMAGTLQNFANGSAELCLVSESGISYPETVRQLRAEGFRGFLMGEHFMKTNAPGGTLSAFVQSITQEDGKEKIPH